jgi:hypothetical protein
MPALEDTSSEELVRVFCRRLRMARAAEIASVGVLYRAEELLMPEGNLPDTPEELDLLARILVRQKRYVEAKKRWNDALRASGGESYYEDALKSLNNYLRTLKWRRQILIFGIFFLSVIISAAIGYHFLK